MRNRQSTLADNGEQSICLYSASWTNDSKPPASRQSKRSCERPSKFLGLVSQNPDWPSGAFCRLCKWVDKIRPLRFADPKATDQNGMVVANSTSMNNAVSVWIALDADGSE